MTFIVDGITCGGCASKIKNGLSSDETISNLDVDVADKKVFVEGTDKLSGMNLKKSIEELGFSVVSMKKES